MPSCVCPSRSFRAVSNFFFKPSVSNGFRRADSLHDSLLYKIWVLDGNFQLQQETVACNFSSCKVGMPFSTLISSAGARGSCRTKVHTWDGCAWHGHGTAYRSTKQHLMAKHQGHTQVQQDYLWRFLTLMAEILRGSYGPVSILNWTISLKKEFDPCLCKSILVLKQVLKHNVHSQVESTKICCSPAENFSLWINPRTSKPKQGTSMLLTPVTSYLSSRDSFRNIWIFASNSTCRTTGLQLP